MKQVKKSELHDSHMLAYHVNTLLDSQEGTLVHAETMQEVIKYREKLDKTFLSLQYGTLQFADVV